MNYEVFKAKFFSSLKCDLRNPCDSWGYWPLHNIDMPWKAPCAIDKAKLNGYDRPLLARIVLKVKSNEQPQFEINKSNKMDKVMITIPFYRLWSFPLTFITYAKHITLTNILPNALNVCVFCFTFYYFIKPVFKKFF